MSNEPSPAEEKGFLIIVSAPSGCGKTTIVDRLLKRHPDWVRSISATTRHPRIGEKDGEDYFFVSPQRFNEMQTNEEFLETVKIFDYVYGTPKAPMLRSLREGKKIVLAIDVQGMKHVKKVLQKDVPVLAIFVLPPSIKVLRERLEGRKTEPPEEIQRRIELAQEEIKCASLYDSTVVNQNLEQTVLEMEALIDQFQKERRKNPSVLHTS
jgi:guanylate kinase